MFRQSVAIYLVFTAVALAQESLGQPGNPKDNLGPEAEAAWQVRFEAIKKELTELGDHPWAGRYYFGDGLGGNFSIALAPVSGFAYELAGCMGVYVRDFGAVIPTERGSLILNSTYAKNGKTIDKELVPISWGQRHYLVRVDHIVRFFNSVNTQREPRTEMHGGYYLKEGDHEKPAVGLPELPDRYYAFFQKEPIKAEIVAVGSTAVGQNKEGWPVHITRVTLNVGSAKVLPGMTFKIHEPPNIIGDARVVSTNEETCEALITQPASDKLARVSPATGWTLTTVSSAPQPVGQGE